MAGSSVMMAFIDFFGTRTVENHATISGAAAGSGQTGKAWAYGLATAGEIFLSSLAGWTGGGGAAAKGVRLSEIGWYELGSQTIKGTVFDTVSTMDKVQLGKKLVHDYGWIETIFQIQQVAALVQRLAQDPLWRSNTGWICCNDGTSAVLFFKLWRTEQMRQCLCRFSMSWFWLCTARVA